MAALEPARVTRAAKLRGIYAILNDAPAMIELANDVLAAGIGIVQYRAKAGINAARLRQLRERTRQCGALLIVNDDWRAAASFACDGVHLGPDDDGFADCSDARAALPHGLIGLSCGSPAEMLAARSMDIDYAGVGAVYATASKNDAGKPIGLDGLRCVIASAHVPICAIGGLGAADMAAVKACGASMAAVISALSSAGNPSDAARKLVAAWNG